MFGCKTITQFSVMRRKRCVVSILTGTVVCADVDTLQCEATRRTKQLGHEPYPVPPSDFLLLLRAWTGYIVLLLIHLELHRDRRHFALLLNYPHTSVGIIHSIDVIERDIRCTQFFTTKPPKVVWRLVNERSDSLGFSR
jgi:hypothetical protein